MSNRYKSWIWFNFTLNFSVMTFFPNIRRKKCNL